MPLDSLTAHAAVAPERNVIVFLGDNVYDDGIPEVGEAQFADARRRLEAQVHAVPPGVRAIFIPGNHDWGHEGAYGLYSIRLQERLIANLAAGAIYGSCRGNGCPGPVHDRYRAVASPCAGYAMVAAQLHRAGQRVTVPDHDHCGRDVRSAPRGEGTGQRPRRRGRGASPADDRR
jgi:hypothetical protein